MITLTFQFLLSICVCATSSPLEHLFTTVGNIVTPDRSTEAKNSRYADFSL